MSLWRKKKILEAIDTKYAKYASLDSFYHRYQFIISDTLPSNVIKLRLRSKNGTAGRAIPKIINNHHLVEHSSEIDYSNKKKKYTR